MGKPNLNKVIPLFEKKEDFSLTRERYLNLTGCDVPQNKSYTENQSAIAKAAKSYGYKVEVVPEILRFILDKDN